MEDAGLHAGIDSSALDPFLLPGDEETWRVEDWNWDPFSMFAAPIDTPNVGCCQALKRQRLSTATDLPPSAPPSTLTAPTRHQACCNADVRATTAFPHATSTPESLASPTAPSTASLHAQNGWMPVTSSGDCRTGTDVYASLPPLNPQHLSLPETFLAQLGQDQVRPWTPTLPNPWCASPNTGHGAGVSITQSSSGSSASRRSSGLLTLADPATEFFASSLLAPNTGSSPAFGIGFSMSSLQPRQPQYQQLAQGSTVAPALIPDYGRGNVLVSHSSLPLSFQQHVAPGNGVQGMCHSEWPQQQQQPQTCSSMPQQQYHAVPLQQQQPQQYHVQQQQQQKLLLAQYPQSQHQPSLLQQHGHNVAAGYPASAAMCQGTSMALAVPDIKYAASALQLHRLHTGGSDVGGGHAAFIKQSGAQQFGAAVPTSISMEGVVTLTESCDDACRMTCQVPGCGKDLSALKEYHQRYRVCEVHIKLPQVLKAGKLQRFCQQCGRFHELAAFEPGRKSCRQQLDKHNARRRRRAGGPNTEPPPAITPSPSESFHPAAPAHTLASPHMEPTCTATAFPDGANHSTATPTPAATAGPHTSINASACVTAAAGTYVPTGAVVASAPVVDVGKLMAALIQNPAQLAALRSLLGVQQHPALPPLPASALGIATEATDGHLAPKLESLNSSLDAPDPESYGLARDVLNGQRGFAPVFSSEHRALRISIKLFNKTPADLPLDMKQQLVSWLDAAPAAAEGAIRPGCVFVTVQLLVSHSVAAAVNADPGSAVLSLLAHLLAYSNGSTRPSLSTRMATLTTSAKNHFWSTGTFSLQLGCSVLLVQDGSVKSHMTVDKQLTNHHQQNQPHSSFEPSSVGQAAEAVDSASVRFQTGGSVRSLGNAAVPTSSACRATSHADALSSGRAAMYPSVTRVFPAVLVAGVQTLVQVEGESLGGGDVEVVLRFGGKCVKSKLMIDPITYAATVMLPPLPGCGAVVWLECARGAFLSEPKPLLLVDDASLARELGMLGASGGVLAGCCPTMLDSLIIDLGLVLQHIQGALLSPGLDHPAVAEKARRLLGFAADMGWEAVAARVLPLATATCSCASEVVAAIHRSTARDGLSLMHRAVRSGSLPMVQAMLAWGAAHGYRWQVQDAGDMAGPLKGITPLHLAALLEDAQIALALLDYTGPSAFTTTHSADGVTPFHLAFQMGHFHVQQLKQELAAAHQDKHHSQPHTLNNSKGPTITPTKSSVPFQRARGDVQVSECLGALDGQQQQHHQHCHPEEHLQQREAVHRHASDAHAPTEKWLVASAAEVPAVDPCEVCASTLPPLLLTILAMCTDCGVRRPCVPPRATAPSQTPSTATAAPASANSCSAPPHHDPSLECSTVPARGSKRSLGSVTADPRCDMKMQLAEQELFDAQGCEGGKSLHSVLNSSPGGDPAMDCVHQPSHTRYSITALCQSCHCNRVLQVAM